MGKLTRWTWLALLLVFGGTFAFAPSSVAAQPTHHWVATWTTAPQAGNWQDEFHNQTVRMIVHTSVGGNRIRVEFSNAFGKRSLRIGAAHIALAGEGAAIVLGSDHPLTFDGSPSIVIPPGALEMSDVVDLHFSPLSNLAISVYVPDQTGPATKHLLGLHTTYISGPGNFVASPDMQTKWEATSYYWISGIDVEAAASAHTIVAFGDSITDGFQSKQNGNMQWPSQLAARLQANPATEALAVANEGIGGNRVLHDALPFGPNALARFDRDVLAQPGVKYMIVLESINDLGFPHEKRGGHGAQEVTAKQLIAGLKQLIIRAHAHGIKVYGGTLTPYQGADYYSAEGEAKREAINQWIRTSGAFDGVIDFDKAVRNPQNPKRILPSYDSGDHLHPNDAGYKAMADAVPLSLFH
jgi:lysophospholipase L1-like esterase